MTEKKTTKDELLRQIKLLRQQVTELQNDCIAYSQGIVNVENELSQLRQMFTESYNPYNKGIRKPEAANSIHALPTDNSIHINIKR